jgi:hypothetical protein
MMLGWNLLDHLLEIGVHTHISVLDRTVEARGDEQERPDAVSISYNRMMGNGLTDRM